MSVAISTAAAALFAATAPSTTATATAAFPTFSTAAAAAAAAPSTAAATSTTSAATVAAATSATSATTEATATAAFTGGALFTRTRDVDGERPATEVLTVEHFDGALGLLSGGELDKREATGAAGELVEHQVDVQDDPGSGEVVLDVSLHRLVGQIAHEETILVVHNTRAASNTAWESAPGRTLNEGPTLDLTRPPQTVTVTPTLHAEIGRRRIATAPVIGSNGFWAPIPQATLDREPA
jgi:hypothetical protein